MLEGDMTTILFLLGILIVGVLLIVVIVITRKAPKGIDREQFQNDWLQIENAVTDDSGSQQLAILNADKLLDKALKQLRYQGNTMGERMTAASRVFTKREAVWAAHKLRNKIAHEDTVKLSQQLTRRALKSFKQALKDVGAL